MIFWEAIVLGIIQGLTEFLPVSSSGHLVLAQYFFGIKEPQLFFDIMLHLGTLGAVIAIFQRDIRDILSAIIGLEPVELWKSSTKFAQAFPKLEDKSPQRMTKKAGRIYVLLIILGSIPTVIIALIIRMFAEKIFANPLLVSFMLLITGMILWLSGRYRPADSVNRGLNYAKALIIGTAQGIAALPGISRSGATISTAIMMGVNGEEAARYSLLLSVPATFGAALIELKDINSINISIWTVLIGMLLAFVTGYLAIRYLLRTLKKGKFSRFAYYCWFVGALGILLLLRDMGATI